MENLKRVSFNTNMFSFRMNELKRRINNGFDIYIYGYAELLGSCKSITIADPEGIPQFAIMPQNRDLSQKGASGKSFVCQESSFIIKQWADEIGLKASLCKGEVAGINHIFLKIPGWGFIGATPFDKRFDHFKINNIKEISASHIDPYNEGLNDQLIFLTKLRPMSWFKTPENMEVYIYASMDLQGGSLGELFRSNFMEINIEADILKGDKQHEYIFRLILRRNKLRFLKNMVAQSGDKMIFKIFSQSDFKGKNIFTIEEGRVNEGLIETIQQKSEGILFNLINKIEAWIPAMLEENPNALKPVK